MKKQYRLGIDFGGVILPMVGKTRGGDTQFSDRFLATPPQTDAVQKIRALVGAFDGNVWIVSKAGARTEELTRQWLWAQDFFGLTGLEDDHVRFCLERPDKLPICLELGITHFVDDRVHIMQILQGTVPNLYLFGDKSKNRSAKRWTTLVEDWTEAYEAIAGSL
ncbi:hypothetical protein N8198_06415 [Gammaproteobacteria bacterium]|nr:hypothetical protein [Gammaproteobacteria bacterium]